MVIAIASKQCVVTVADGQPVIAVSAYDGVVAPFEAVKPIYDFLQQVMGPLGLQVDYERIKAERPNIAELLSAQ